MKVVHFLVALCSDTIFFYFYFLFFSWEMTSFTSVRKLAYVQTPTFTEIPLYSLDSFTMFFKLRRY